MKTFLILLLIYRIASSEVEVEPYEDEEARKNEVNFCVFASQERNVTYKEHMVLNEVGFNKSLPTVFVIHGYQSGYGFVKDFQEAYGSDVTKKMNLIGIDWSIGASTWYYPTAVRRTPIIGSAVGEFIISSIRNNVIVSPYNVHIVGHSLGAHIAGFIGKYMAGNGTTLHHITALDPAGPLIGSYDCPDDRLCNTDASFVEILHTNGGTLGMWSVIEPLDMYLNGGSRQPGCILPTCSHSFSHQWYRTVLNERNSISGWLCTDLDEMESKKMCNHDGNPREYRLRIIQTEVKDGGICYVPTGSANYVKRKGRTPTPMENETIVVFGVNKNMVNALVSLLSDDGHLVIELRHEEIMVLNPSNFNWKPDPKYIVCNETHPDDIRKFVGELNGPFRFIVVFDTTDMFTDQFWEMIIYLDQQAGGATSTTGSGPYSSQLKMVSMNIPHDKIVLDRHIIELKNAIQNELQYHHGADFQMVGMHTIEESGPLHDMTELRNELAVIKNAVDQ